MGNSDNAKKLTMAAQDYDYAQDYYYYEYACWDEVKALFTCVDLECITCMIGVFSDTTHINESTTCETLEEGTFCDDISECFEGPCAAVDCDAEAEALETCEAENHPAEDGEDCPGLCEGPELQL